MNALFSVRWSFLFLVIYWYECLCVWGVVNNISENHVSVFRADVLLRLSFTLPLLFELRTLSSPTDSTRDTYNKILSPIKVRIYWVMCLPKKIPINSNAWDNIYFNEFNTKFDKCKWACMCGGRGVDHSAPSSVEVKEGKEIYFYSPSGHSCLLQGKIYFTLTVCLKKLTL
jgi:hypothetical protein